MKAVIFKAFGDPTKVLELAELPEVEPQPGQVRVRMIAAPINPSDLLVVRGSYGKLPMLPATPGFEGVGVVEKSGGGLLGWRVMGRRVAVLNSHGGNWAEKVVIPARQAVPLPADIPDKQAASFFVNPATVLAMIHKLLRLPRGAWLLQTAAASSLGQMVVRLGRHEGFRTINVVRRPESAELVARLGGDVVINSSRESIVEAVLSATGGRGVAYAIDAVGGQTASDVVAVLAEHGRILLFGTLSGEPIRFDPRTLMIGGKRIEGFWLSDWVRAQGPLAMLGLFRKISKLMRAGVLTTECSATFSLNEITAAVQAAAEPGRQGKVLLKMT